MAMTPPPTGSVEEEGTLASARVDAEKEIDPPVLSMVSITPSGIRPVSVINQFGSRQVAVPLIKVQKALPCNGANGGIPDPRNASLGFTILMEVGSKFNLNWKAANPGDGKSATTTSTSAFSPTLKLTTEGLKLTLRASALEENNTPNKNITLRERRAN